MWRLRPGLHERSGSEKFGRTICRLVATIPLFELLPDDILLWAGQA